MLPQLRRCTLSRLAQVITLSVDTGKWAKGPVLAKPEMENNSIISKSWINEAYYSRASIHLFAPKENMNEYKI